MENRNMSFYFKKIRDLRKTEERLEILLAQHDECSSETQYLNQELEDFFVFYYDLQKQIQKMQGFDLERDILKKKQAKDKYRSLQKDFSILISKIEEKEKWLKLFKKKKDELEMEIILSKNLYAKLQNESEQILKNVKWDTLQTQYLSS